MNQNELYKWSTPNRCQVRHNHVALTSPCSNRGCMLKNVEVPRTRQSLDSHEHQRSNTPFKERSCPTTDYCRGISPQTKPPPLAASLFLHVPVPTTEHCTGQGPELHGVESKTVSRAMVSGSGKRSVVNEQETVLPGQWLNQRSLTSSD